MRTATSAPQQHQLWGPVANGSAITTVNGLRTVNTAPNNKVVVSILCAVLHRRAVLGTEIPRFFFQGS